MADPHHQLPERLFCLELETMSVGNAGTSRAHCLGQEAESSSQPWRLHRS